MLDIPELEAINVRPLNKMLAKSIQTTIDGKTKPLGALGQLEPLAKKLQLIANQRASNLNSIKSAANKQGKLSLAKATMVVFAGDHGINEENLSIATSDVTRQMVLNFLHGGAAINCFCRSNNIALTVVDCGILVAIKPEDIPDSPSLSATPILVTQRLGAGTKNFANQAAMTAAQVNQGFIHGKKLTEQLISEGVDILLLGEMGIANTSSAAALMAALTPNSVEQCVGRGTGISDEQLSRKVLLISKALTRVAAKLPLNESSSLDDRQLKELLGELAGFEIVQMVASILTAAADSVPVVIDGFIVSVAALVAICMQPNVSDFLIYAHVSQEKAHQLLLAELAMKTNDNSQPLLDLGLRLGEGTGAALALPLIQAAASFYIEMASFSDAGVTV